MDHTAVEEGGGQLRGMGPMRDQAAAAEGAAIQLGVDGGGQLWGHVRGGGRSHEGEAQGEGELGASSEGGEMPTKAGLHDSQNSIGVQFASYCCLQAGCPHHSIATGREVTAAAVQSVDDDDDDVKIADTGHSCKRAKK